MKEITKKLYDFTELSEKAKENIREVITEVWTGERTIEAFIENIKNLYGFEIDADKVYWSGFYSQGDGACFELELNENFVEDYIVKTKQKKRFNYLLRYIHSNDVGIYFHTVRVDYYYNHYNTYGLDSDVSISPLDDKREQRLEDDIEYIRKEIEDLYRELCKQLYSNLEDAYDAYISDENIIELCKCNNMMFFEDGEMYFTGDENE